MPPLPVAARLAPAVVAILSGLPLVATTVQHPAQPDIPLRAGLIITRPVRIRPGIYRLPAPASPDSAVIVIKGDNITVDFQGAVLEGTGPGAEPDQAAGVAIQIEGGRNVRLEHATVRGYKVGILARGTTELVLSGNDVSHNWKPRLFSLIEHESLADWLSFHHNEAGEWLRFGAGIYLDGVRLGTIQGNRAEQGMNGLLLTRSDSLRILDNTFAFNSGLGIGLYRSSYNSIVHNCLDYNVRGFSQRFYRRGQDSAGLLLFEQSSHNTVAWNSVTHGGDGLFLWAGQETMDSGAGGSNDNLFLQNDFSFAPANAMEATFSRNAFIANRAEGSDHGLWGGYSYESTILANCFGGNRIGIAIEHGQSNVIGHNRFRGDSTAISLWADPLEPSDWGYPKRHDTRSRDYLIGDNGFEGNRVGLRALNTSMLRLTGNRFVAVDTPTVLRDTSEYLARTLIPGAGSSGAGLEPCDSAAAVGGSQVEAEAEQRSIPRSPESRRPRSAILVDEWGPFDWRSPRLWPLDSTRAKPLALATVGPTGRWRVLEQRGIRSLSRLQGRIGDTIVVTPAPGPAADWQLSLEYRADDSVIPRHARRSMARPVPFSYRRFEPELDWQVRFVSWADSTDPRTRPEGFAALFNGTPLLTRRESRLDYLWYRPGMAGLPQQRFALEARTNVSLPPGEYTLRTISDDGVRVWLDDRLVIDDWAGHESAVAHAPLPAGRHQLRVQYYQADGWTELRVELLRGRISSTGSPGPH
jgi:parallel beta-helix repeat protein